MTEYLVESHLGGYYTSMNDPEFITEMCDECGDSDTIILEWDAENGKKEMHSALKGYVNSFFTTDEETLKQKSVDYITDDMIDLNKYIEEFKYIIYYEYVDANYFIYALLESEIITKYFAGVLKKLCKENVAVQNEIMGRMDFNPLLPIIENNKIKKKEEAKRVRKRRTDVNN